jgi:hypothetical protein
MAAMRLALSLSLLLAGCHGVSTLAGATVTTSAALAASGAQRAAGGCWAVCTNGTSCNPRTGLCEVLPCRGRCGADEHCEEDFAESKCMPGATGDVTAQSKGQTSKLPLFPNGLPPLSGPPTVVPAAEQNPPSGK